MRNIMANMVTVGAFVEDEAKHSDGAYDLLGIWAVDEFLAELRKTLESDWGLTHAVGDVRLVIDIRKGVHPDG